MLAPPLRIHSWRVKWSPDSAETTDSGTTATWLEPLKEKIRDESEDGRVGRAEVQLAAGDGGGRRSTSPLTAPDTKKRGDAHKQRIWLPQICVFSCGKAEPTTQTSHRSVRVAVSVTALSDVASLELYGGLDVPHGLLTGLQMQAGEQGNAAWPGCVFYTLGPSFKNKKKKILTWKSQPHLYQLNHAHLCHLFGPEIEFERRTQMAAAHSSDIKGCLIAKLLSIKSAWCLIAAMWELPWVIAE